MTVRVVLALALASVLAFPSLRSWERRADEDALAAIAGSIAEREVEIDCPGTFEDLTAVSPHDGTVEFGPDGSPADRAKFSGGTCEHLRRLRRDEIDLRCLATSAPCPRDVERTAVAVNVLAHEAFHLAGEREEWLAQCQALQANFEVALRLGQAPRKRAAWRSSCSSTCSLRSPPTTSHPRVKTAAPWISIPSVLAGPSVDA